MNLPMNNVLRTLGINLKPLKIDYMYLTLAFEPSSIE